MRPRKARRGYNAEYFGFGVGLRREGRRDSRVERFGGWLCDLDVVGSRMEMQGGLLVLSLLSLLSLLLFLLLL